jgi:BirA family transcriptional regulator, biotin operon repressor / biotin---[acetyl-CoA-carboxylase] ligase
VPDSPYSDLDRPPLNAHALRRALLVPGGLWTRLDLRVETGSTNADAAEAARAGEPEGLVVVAERQRAGRGRQGRAWVSPPRAGIAASVLLRPGEAAPGRGWPPAPLTGYGWLPLLAGVALVEAVRRVAEIEAALKWPNDLLVAGTFDGGGYAKCAGILAETVPAGTAPAGSVPAGTMPAGTMPHDRGPDPTGDGGPGAAGCAPAVVLGIGLNVTLRADELPPGVGGLPATSLRLAGSPSADRDPLLRALLRTLADWYARWRRAGGDPVASGVRAAYEVACATLGSAVRVVLPARAELLGTAVGVDLDGRLLVRSADGEHAVAAGDVVHVR